MRHKMVAGLSATVAGLFVVAAVGGTAQAVLISQKNQTLTLTNSQLDEARAAAVARQLEAEKKQKLAERAAQAANAQNQHAVETEVKMLGLLESRLKFVPGLQDVRSEMLTQAIKNLDDAARVMTTIRDDIAWSPEDEQNNLRTLAHAHQRFGDLSLSLNRFTDAMQQFRLMDEIIATMARANPDDALAQFRLRAHPATARLCCDEQAR